MTEGNQNTLEIKWLAWQLFPFQTSRKIEQANGYGQTSKATPLRGEQWGLSLLVLGGKFISFALEYPRPVLLIVFPFRPQFYPWPSLNSVPLILHPYFWPSPLTRNPHFSNAAHIFHWVMLLQNCFSAYLQTKWRLLLIQLIFLQGKQIGNLYTETLKNFILLGTSMKQLKDAATTTSITIKRTQFLVIMKCNIFHTSIMKNILKQTWMSFSFRLLMQNAKH